MTTFNQKQKIEAYKAFSRGWKSAVNNSVIWNNMDAQAKVRFFRNSVMEEIFNLPEKQSWWKKLFKKVFNF
jgi:hypothetical protein